MIVTQISVFLENRPGRLKYLFEVLSDAGINLRALSLADSADFGIARMIVPDTPATLRVIRGAGLTAATTQVLQMDIPDVPGGLARSVISPLADAGVNIEYTYAYSEGTAERAIVVLKVDDLEKAEQALGA